MLTEDEDSRAGKRKVKREEEGKEKGSGETKGTKSREKESERCFFVFFPLEFSYYRTSLRHSFTYWLHQYTKPNIPRRTEYTPK